MFFLVSCIAKPSIRQSPIPKLSDSGAYYRMTTEVPAIETDSVAAGKENGKRIQDIFLILC